MTLVDWADGPVLAGRGATAGGDPGAPPGVSLDCAKAGAHPNSASTTWVAKTVDIAQPVGLNMRESLQIGAQNSRSP